MPNFFSKIYLKSKKFFVYFFYKKIKEIESHVNECLDRESARKYASYNSDDESKKLDCPFCQKDLSLYNDKRKEQHLSRCRTNEKKSQEEEQEEKELSFNQDECLICQKNISNLQQKLKTNHLKLCAKIKKLKPKEVVELLSLYKKIPKKKIKKENAPQKEKDELNNFFEEFKYDPKGIKTLTNNSNSIPKSVEDWLVSLKMDDYIDSFIDNGYDSLEVCCEV